MVEESKAVLLEVAFDSKRKASLSYQWLADGRAIKEGKSFAGTASSILCITEADLGMDGVKFSFDVKASDLRTRQH